MENSRYKDLLVWQKSLAFVNLVLDLIDNIETTRKHYRLIEQLEAAATSVSMNIAEGREGNQKKNSCNSNTFQGAHSMKRLHYWRYSNLEAGSQTINLMNLNENQMKLLK